MGSTKVDAIGRGPPARSELRYRSGGTGVMLKSKSRCVLTSGLALAFGAGALALGTGAATAAARLRRARVTANTITVGSISDISAPIAGLFEGAKVGTQAYFAYDQQPGRGERAQADLDGMDSAFSSGTVANEAAEHRHERLRHRRRLLAARRRRAAGHRRGQGADGHPGAEPEPLHATPTSTPPSRWSTAARPPAPSSGSRASTPRTSRPSGSSAPTRPPPPSPPSTPSRT